MFGLVIGEKTIWQTKSTIVKIMWIIVWEVNKISHVLSEVLEHYVKPVISMEKLMGLNTPIKNLINVKLATKATN